MAALSDSPLPEVVELSRLSMEDLDSLFEEEIHLWDRRFAWDFRPSADLLRRFQQMQSLNGFAVRFGRDLRGYAYHVCEQHKGLIGDFFVRPDDGNSAAEMVLLGATVQELMLTPGIRRIESQLMMLQTPAGHVLPFNRFLTRHDRYFMEVSRETVQRLPALEPQVRVSFLPWAERFREDTAYLIAASYQGHVDSEINDQYRTIPGARRFLNNIVKFPGCGRFLPSASVVAIDENTGRLCGVSLTSLVSANSGHVTQLCVLPAIRGARVGYEVLRQSLIHLVRNSCQSVSLTVTCSNVGAIRLYQSVGFEITNTFPALVWEGF
jgi:ribosomal protein S18 acetylase RimI-like enzyme